MSQASLLSQATSGAGWTARFECKNRITDQELSPIRRLSRSTRHVSGTVRRDMTQNVIKCRNYNSLQPCYALGMIAHHANSATLSRRPAGRVNLYSFWLSDRCGPPVGIAAELHAGYPRCAASRKSRDLGISAIGKRNETAKRVDKLRSRTALRRVFGSRGGRSKSGAFRIAAPAPLPQGEFF